MRILGIDAGSTGIKAVEVESSFRRFEVQEYHERPISPGQEPFDAIHDLIRSLPRQPEKIVVSLRSGQVTFRNIELPTRDKKAIQSSVMFELEDDLPFELEDAVFDYTNLAQTGPKTQVHVAATLRRYVELCTGFWNMGGVDPDVTTTEGWAYRTLMNRIHAKQPIDEPVLVAQIGHERTTLYVHWRGVPVVSREISWGGRDLTMAICRKYGIPMEEAEQSKIDNGFVLAGSQKETATSEQIEFSDTLVGAIMALIQEIKQADLTCKNAVHENIGAIYLSGGTSLLPGLAARLEEELKLPTAPLRAMSSIGDSGVTYSEHTDAAFALALAMALCQVGQDRTGCINLRKGTLAKHAKTTQFNLDMLRGPLIAAGAVTASLLLSLVVQSNVYDTQLTHVNEQLEKSLRSFFGSISASGLRTYLSDTSALKSRIESELKQQQEQANLLGKNERSPLDFLNQISKAIPKNVKVDLTEIQVGQGGEKPFSGQERGKAMLTFRVAEPSVADELKKALQGQLEGLTQTQPEPVTLEDGTKGFKVSFTGTPSEAAYGK